MEHSISNYQKLNVWQQSYKLSLEIYKVTQNFPTEEKFGLASQMHRCAVSITSKIAEGSGRETAKDKSHFYTVSKGSANELETQILIAEGLGFRTQKQAKKIVESCVSILKMLTKLFKLPTKL